MSKLVKCNRRGSVSAGPLTLKFGVNEVDPKDYETFLSTKFGKAAVDQGWVEEIKEIRKSDVVAKKPEKVEEPKQPEEPEAEETDYPTKGMSAKEAVEFVASVEDIDQLVEIAENDARKSVQSACEKRAEELED